MRPPAPLRPRPSVILALELLGLDEPAPEGRLRQALALINEHLGDRESARLHEKCLLVAGRRVLRVAPIKRGGTILFWELLDLLHLQGELVQHQIFVRGAITLGDAVASAEVVAGPGPTEAERLRDEVADVPRVIVDPRLIRETERNPYLRASHHTVPMELGYIQKLLRIDADGLWFVDYLSAFASEVDEPSLYLDFLDDHRRWIEQRLGATSGLDRGARAWTWLWSYHNRVVEEARLSEAERARLRLSDQSELMYVFPPSAKAPE